MSIASYQDDHILIFMGKILSDLFDSLLFVETTLQIPLSPKPKPNMPYAVRHEALGLSIDGTKNAPQIGPTMGSREKYIIYWARLCFHIFSIFQDVS